MQCFHCAEPVPANLHLTSHLLGEVRSFCCPGCQTVAETIIDSGCEQYYTHRNAPATSVKKLGPALPELDVMDLPEAQHDFVTQSGAIKQADMSLQGLSCAACAWLIEHRLRQLDGLDAAAVNFTNHRLTVRYDETRLPLSRVFDTIQTIGYRAFPYVQNEHESLLKKESQAQFRRLAVSALGAMQAMMFAAGIYIGLFQGIAPEFRNYLRFVSFLVATPVVLYAGWPFYVSAWRVLRLRHLNMDVPISIALLCSYLASTYAMVTHQGETYFDGVSMFIFFVTASRYLEMRARHKAGEIAGNLQFTQPRLAMRMEQGEWCRVATETLSVGDRLLVRPGETFPCDGQVQAGTSSVSEAMLSGEGLPIRKKPHDAVIGGTQNLEQPLEVTVTAVGQATVMAALQQLLSRASLEKPPQVMQADKLSSIFIARVLMVSVVVYGIWFFIDPHRAFWNTIAVLVATCPCALSLATPAALTTATNTLAGKGFLITRGHALETLADATHFIFDKTGTLTQGQLALERIILLNGDVSMAKSIAASLENASDHPIAKAFHFEDVPQLPSSDCGTAPGLGVYGRIQEVAYRLGRSDYVLGVDNDLPSPDDDAAGLLWILLAEEHGKPLAWFGLSDQLRSEAVSAVKALKQAGIHLSVLSGDTQAAASRLGHKLGIDDARGGLSAEDKNHVVKALQEAGHVVVMVGDGVNDAPVLARANLSIAMGSGTDLAKTSADTLLLRDHLMLLPQALNLARRCRRITKQNLRWAFVYNLAMLPPAALGYIPPYIAGLGMSLSSLAVVTNALRLRKE